MTTEPIQQHTVPVAGWTDEAGNPLKITIVVTPDGKAHIPLTFLCGVVGIADARQQRERIMAHKALASLMSQQFIQTPKGIRTAWCLERRGIGFWLGSLQVSKTRPAIQTRLIEFQWAIVDAADRLLFGEVEARPVQAHLTTLDAQVAGVTRFVLAIEERLGRVEERIHVPPEEEE